MDQNLDIVLIGALIVVVMGEYDQIKAFLLFNRLALNVLVAGKKLQILAQLVTAKEINKPQKKYL